RPAVSWHRRGAMPAPQDFSSTDQYALSKKDFQLLYRRLESFRLSAGLVRGWTGSRIRRMPASQGVRPPLRTLHLRQAQAMFSRVAWPPRLRGRTWSRLSSLVANRLPQYWQRLTSLAKMFRRLNLTFGRGRRSEVRSRITRGTWTSKWTVRMYPS